MPISPSFSLRFSLFSFTEHRCILPSFFCDHTLLSMPTSLYPSSTLFISHCLSLPLVLYTCFLTLSLFPYNRHPKSFTFLLPHPYLSLAHSSSLLPHSPFCFPASLLSYIKTHPLNANHISNSLWPWRDLSHPSLTSSPTFDVVHVANCSQPLHASSISLSV